MATNLSFQFRHLIAAMMVLSLCLGSLSGPAFAQKASDKAENDSAKAASTETDEKAAEEAEKDPFAVPEDANAKELFDFITAAKMKRGRMRETVMRSAKAVVAGATAIRELDDVDPADELKAIKEQLGALAFLSRYDADSRKQLKDILEKLENHDNPEFARFALLEGFKTKSGTARTASREEQLELIKELKSLIEGRDFDRESYMLASGLARSIGYSDNADVAASLYEDLASMMSKSSDAQMKDQAPKMLGAARRMRLIGNPMEIVGTTTEGEQFDWDSYRGKVVLVDFWASWCGPCRAEVPNMKRNLALYGEQGFAILGVNLDNTLEACEKYVQQEDLEWTNLFSQEDSERGWNNPLVTYYGVSGIPTAILVGADGNVVSLKARGKELDRLLKDLLGEPEGKVEDDKEEEAETKS